MIESPLKRTKILRALVKYRLLARDRIAAAEYFRQWEQSARKYGIKAEQKDIDRLRSAVATADSPGGGIEGTLRKGPWLGKKRLTTACTWSCWMPGSGASKASKPSTPSGTSKNRVSTWA